MRIVIHCGGMPYNGETPKVASLGGSETAAWALARELAGRGHSVVAFTNGKPGVFDGVLYENMGPTSEDQPLGASFHLYTDHTPSDAVIVQRHPLAFQRPMTSKCNLWWTHDLALRRTQPMVGSMLWNVDKVVTVSEWHRRQLAEAYKVPLDSVMAIRNGIYPADFVGLEPPLVGKGTPFPTECAVKKLLTFTHRPERGLENLVAPGGIMEQLGEDFHLLVCHYDNPIPDQRIAAYHEQLWQRCNEMANVTLLPPQTKRDLYALMKSAWLHVYPAMFEETSCITAMETQAAGLPIICTTRGALPETLAGAGADFVPPADGKVDTDEFVRRIRSLAANPDDYERLRGRCDGNRYAWSEAATQWERLIEDTLAAKSAKTGNLFRYYLLHSDLMAIRDLEAKGLVAPPDVAEDLAERYAWADGTDEGALAQNTRHHDWLYQSPGFPWYDPNFKDNNRFKSVRGDIAALPDGAIILDVGPAEGCLLTALASDFPDKLFVGLEAEPRNIRASQAKAQELGLQNVVICEGTLQDPGAAWLSYFEQASAVILGEVLEHVPRPWDLLQALNAQLPAGTRIVMTVPQGPTDNSPLQVPGQVPVHLHHFEPAGMSDMVGHFPGFKLGVVPIKMSWLGPEGHLVTRFNTDPALTVQPVNYERKHRQQAPLESLSVCMIARDAAHTIGKTLASVRWIADEIIVAVDENTTDRTREIVAEFGGRTFDIKSPLEIGFDAARNLSIEQATCDWILWIDSDEEFIYQERAFKYFRANCSAGYTVLQHHLSVEPLGLLKTDLPCRLFRNGRGVRFFGRVHEHPEDGLNKALPFVTGLGDVSIAHPAYTTEAVRRQRFARNWPLMVRDRQDYPDRELGLMLWVRDCSYQVRSIVMEGGRCSEFTLDQLIAMAEDSFHKLLEKKHLRFSLEALEYYSLMNIMLERGFFYEGAVRGATFGAGLPDNVQGTRIVGRFMDQRELRALNDMVISEALSGLTGDYL